MRKLMSIVMAASLAVMAFAGNQVITWTDYASNPLNLHSTGARAYMPAVVYNPAFGSNAYKIWYDVDGTRILATNSSADGITWNATSQAVVGLATTVRAGRTTVLYNSADAKPYKIWYNSNTDNMDLRFAQSADGVTFSDDTYCLTLGAWNEGHAVLLDGGVYHLYYGANNTLCHMTSYNGYTFSSTGLTVSLSTAISIKPTSIVKVGANDYRMWADESNTKIHYLVSTDGNTWTMKESPATTVGSVGAAGTWNASRNYYSSVVYLGNGQFKMWRGGYSTAYVTGYATGTDPELSVSEWALY